MVPNGWYQASLDKIAKVIDCKHRTPIYVEDGIPLISPGTIKWGPIDLDSPSKRVTPEEHESLMDHCKVQVGDLVMSRNQSVGVASYINTNRPFVLGQDTVLIQPIKTDPKFLFYSLQSLGTQKRILKLAGGSTFSRINLADIRKIQVSFPKQQEQQKIAQILSTWDKAIEKLEALIAAKQKRKKALMQQLLTGKKRFAGFEDKWKSNFLGEIAHITTGSSNRQDSHLNGPFTFFDRSEDIRTSDIYLFDGEAVIVAGEGQDFIPKYFVGKFDLHQRTYAIMNFKNCDGKFLYYKIAQNRNHFLSQAVGSTVKSLRLPMFKKMELLLPTLNEQIKIASVLCAADTEITTHQKHLSALKEQKKGLMQQLLTGKKRVKVDSHV